MTIDQTKKPLRIPPKFGTYAEEHDIFNILKVLMEQIILQRPADPLSFMIDYLKQDLEEVPKIIIHGGYCSGKRSIAKLVAKRLNSVFLTVDNIIEDDASEFGSEARKLKMDKNPIPDELMNQLVLNRLEYSDAKKTGWVMAGYPRTRDQAHKLQTSGVLASQFVVLTAPDEVLVERSKGKRVDPETGDVYHTTFDYPSDYEVEKRLVHIPENDDLNYITNELINFHRNEDGLRQSYSYCYQTVNADQPKADVFSQVLTVVSNKARSASPHTPRIVILGPIGAGKATQAALLAKKYNVVHVDLKMLIRSYIADTSNMGLTIKTYVEKNMEIPDNFLLRMIEDRLSRLDCVSKGWILTGFPKNSSQAEALDRTSLKPNRVFFLDVPDDSILERICQRALDPLTGIRYHMLYNPPPSKEVRERLQRHPNDRDDFVSSKITEYYDFIEDLREYYTSAQTINGDQDPHTVFETIESLLVNPIPHNYKR